jgi:hypothetical protein
VNIQKEIRRHWREISTYFVEALKGIRTLLDARIERLSKQSQAGAKITVE